MIYSHPSTPLSQHIDNVLKSVEFIMENHSSQSFFGELDFQEQLRYIVRMHDLGKASSFFQEYIKDPKNYKDKPKKKAHALLSALLAIFFSM